MAVFENSCSGNYGGGYRIRIEVNENSTNVTNNTSNVTIVVKCYAINSSYGNYGYSNPTRIYVDGAEKAYNNPTTDYRNQRVNTLCSWTGDIEHDSLGNKTINVGASFSSSSSSLSGGSVSGNVQLSYIPRASSISASSADIGSNTNINISRADNSFTHTITYNFGNLSGTIVTKTNNTSVSWTIPTSFYAQIPNAKSGTCSLTCKTYSGNTEIGTSTTTLTVTANEELCRPDLNVAVEDINDVTIALTGESTKLVKYRSTARISTSSNAKNSATISKITINGVDGGIRIIENVETNVFEVIVTDSRGYSKKIISTIPMVNYIPLTASSSFKRVSNTSDKVNLTYSGNYWDGDFGSEYNTLVLTYKYREKGSDTWINGTSVLNPTITDNKFNATLELIEDFNYRKNWEFSLYYEDELTSGNTGINNVLKGNGALEIYETAIKVNGDIILKNTNIFELIYPVGSIYISTNNANPNTLFGVGTWEAFGTGRTLVGIDTNQTEFNTIEKTGGSKALQQHTHSARLNNNGGHTHNMKFGGGANSGDGSIVPIASTFYGMDNGSMTDGSHDHGGITVDNAGTGDSGNLQPYITVYMWKRVS